MATDWLMMVILWKNHTYHFLSSFCTRRNLCELSRSSSRGLERINYSLRLYKYHNMPSSSSSNVCFLFYFPRFCCSYPRWCNFTFNLSFLLSSQQTYNYFKFYFSSFFFTPFCQIPTQNLPFSHKQRTVLSCSSLQMPVTAQSPMVCEHKVICPILSLS